MSHKFRKKIMTVILAICITSTLLPAAAFADGDASETVNAPKTYTFTSSQIFGLTDIRANIYFKGDTIVFTPDAIEPFASTDRGKVKTPNVGVSIGGGADVTGGICSVNTYSSDGSGYMVSFTITSDTPITLDYKGAGPTGVQTTPDSNNNSYAYRQFELQYTSYPTTYLIDYNFEYGGNTGSWGNVVNYPTELRLNGRTGAYELQVPSPTSDSGLTFSHWIVSENAGILQLGNPGGSYEYNAYPVNGISYIPVLIGYGRSGSRTGDQGFTLRAYWTNSSSTTYPLTVTNGTGDGSYYNTGVRIPICADLAPEGQRFKVWTITDNGGKANALDFGAIEDVTAAKTFFVTGNFYEGGSIEATYEAAPSTPSTPYAVNVLTDGNGEAGGTPTTATAGTPVTLYANPHMSFQFKEWQVISGNISINGNTFIMPDGPVSIKAIFESGSLPPAPSGNFTVSKMLSANGSISVDKAEASAGDVVTVTAAPNDGYTLKKIIVFDGLGQDLAQEIGLTITNNSFVMPSMNVKILGVFEKINDDGKTNEYTATGSGIEGKITFATELPDDYILDIRTSQAPDSLKKDGVAAMVFRITLMHNNQPVPISDNQMIITIALPEELLGKDVYYVSYMNDDGELSEMQIATLTGSLLQYTTSHLSDYLVEASTSAAKANDTSVATTTPKTGDSGNTLLWIVLILVSVGALTALNIIKKHKNMTAE